MTKRVLLTGVAGFIGSELARHILRETDWEIVALDSLRHRGTTDRLTTEVGGQSILGSHGRARLVRHDLAAPISSQMAARIGPVDAVLALASKSHVDTSIAEPREFAENNIAVALTTLEYVREFSPAAHLVWVSTDEVYGPVAAFGETHQEWSPFVPSNPYSASKAAQEALAVSYWRTYDLPVSVVNMHNVYGPCQHAEKFIPKVVSAVRDGRTVQIHGTAESNGSRCWLYVADAVAAIAMVASELAPARFSDGADRPSRWNIASAEQVTNLDLASLIALSMGRPLSWEWSNARPGRDQHYGLDGSKLADAGWKPAVRLEQGLEQTVRWYTEHPEWLLA